MEYCYTGETQTATKDGSSHMERRRPQQPRQGRGAEGGTGYHQGSPLSFSGYRSGETPLELFDAGRWLECLHGCMIGITVTHEHIEDDGVLHELVHLALGIPICHQSSMGYIRDEVGKIQMAAQAEMHDQKEPRT
jgi:hypothetical protein